MHKLDKTTKFLDEFKTFFFCLLETSLKTSGAAIFLLKQAQKTGVNVVFLSVNERDLDLLTSHTKEISRRRLK